MKKSLLLLMITMVICTYSSFAQDEEPTEKKGFDKEKLFIGGNFGLSFSSNYSLVNVSPQLGYRFNRYLAAGAGVNFLFSSQKSYYLSGADAFRTNYTVGGLNIFGRVYPIEQILIQLQPEMNYVWLKEKYYDGFTPTAKLSKFVPALLAGAGGVIPTGSAGGVVIMAQYDVLQKELSPYGNKVFFSIGYNVGL